MEVLGAAQVANWQENNFETIHSSLNGPFVRPLVLAKGCQKGTPFPFLPPDPSAGPKTDATRMQKRMQMIPII